MKTVRPSPWEWALKFLPGALDPMERISEVLFGLIMVLTCTGSLSATGLDRGEVRTMLIGALGCNLAWGIIDAIMYLMDCYSARGRRLLMLRRVRGTADPEEAHRLIADALPPEVASALLPSDLDLVWQKIRRLPEPPAAVRFNRTDWLGAVGVFLLVFLSTLPLVIPFIFIREVRLALRISNAVAIAMLFLCGHTFGRYSGHSPWKTGLLMVFLGAVLVGITIALGG